MHTLQEIRARQRQQNAAVLDAVEVALRGERAGALAAALEATQYGLADRALRKIIRMDVDPSPRFRAAWLQQHVEHGCSMREWMNNDLLFLDASRKLLPPYTGEARTLYRGETKANRTRRTYGMCWTDDVEIARDFARRHAASGVADTVVIEARVPASGIVCAPALIEGDPAGEREYILDRRHLAHVQVIERYIAAMVPLACPD